MCGLKFYSNLAQGGQITATIVAVLAKICSLTLPSNNKHSKCWL